MWHPAAVPPLRDIQSHSRPVDKATAEALDNVSARSGKARGWIIAELWTRALSASGRWPSRRTARHSREMQTARS